MKYGMLVDIRSKYRISSGLLSYSSARILLIIKPPIANLLMLSKLLFITNCLLE